MPSTTRRSISLKGITASRLRAHCDNLGVPISTWLEELIAEKLDAAGAPVPERVKPRNPKHDPPPPKIGSGIWEF